MRKAVLAALEGARTDKLIGSAMEAAVTITAPADLVAACAGLDLAELCITASAQLHEGETLAVRVTSAPGDKCQRCWNIRPTLNQAQVCDRCAEVLAAV